MTEQDRAAAVEPGFPRWYGRLVNWLAGGSMALVVLVMAVQVFARYVLNASLIWAEELCRYILVWMTFLFIGAAFQRGEFVTVDILTAALSPRRRFVLKAVVAIPVLVFLALMVTNGYAYATRFAAQKIPALDFIWMSLTGGETADISVFWIYVSVPIGSALLFMHVLVDLVLEGRTVFTDAAIPPQR